jgi:uncharacterized protein (TIGR02145 family)
MKILNTRQFNEKLNIQPVTKERLNSLMLPVTVNGVTWSSRNYNKTDGLVKGEDYFVYDNEVFYSFDAAKRITPKGWHIPHGHDVNVVRQLTDNPTDLISKDNGGYDKYGLNFKLCGEVYVGENIVNGTRFSFWCDIDGVPYIFNGEKRVDTLYLESIDKSKYFLNLRFVKD